MTLTELMSRPFRDERLREQALTHKSFANENPQESTGDNERLEFLGDAVVDLIIGDILYRKHSELTEGELSKARASLVNEVTLAGIAKQMGLDQKVRLGRGEVANQGARKPRILASALEALVGAFYLDQGFDGARELVEQLFADSMLDVGEHVRFSADFKTRLQELAQGRVHKPPVYSIVREEGPDHDKMFTVKVELEGQFLAEGSGRSKKQAEQEAARIALENYK